MSQVTYYPAQRLYVGDTENPSTNYVKLLQSADIDFSISRQDVFEFGTFWAVDNIQVEPATANLNFSYAIGTNAGNHTLLKLDDLGTLLSDVNGMYYSLTGAGKLAISNGLINSYSVECSVGNIPTATVGVNALNVVYTAGSPIFPANGGTATSTEVARPDQVSISFNTTSFECRSFSLNLDIPREYVNKLGALDPIANILTGPPKVTVEAEIVLRSSAQPKFANETDVDIVIDLGNNIEYTLDGAKIAGFTSTTSLDDIQVATVTLETALTNNTQLSIGA